MSYTKCNSVTSSKLKGAINLKHALITNIEGIPRVTIRKQAKCLIQNAIQ